MSKLSGGCLCGQIRYETVSAPSNPHFCSCTQCQKWAGAPVVAWVDFGKDGFSFVGPGGEPTLYRSSDFAQRGHCSACGGTICAIDDGSDVICITISSLDTPDEIVPKGHSFAGTAPAWLRTRGLAKGS